MQTEQRHFASLDRAFRTTMASTHSGRRDASTSATSSIGTALAHECCFSDYVGSSAFLLSQGHLPGSGDSRVELIPQYTTDLLRSPTTPSPTPTSSAVAPSERAAHDRSAAAVRSALGEEAFAAAWAEGRAMVPEDAIRYALEEGTDA